MTKKRRDMVTPPPTPVRPRGASVTEEDVGQLHETLNKVVSVVNRSAAHTERIPEIEQKIEQTGKDVVRLETKMDNVTERVGRVEQRAERPHDCYQVDVIAELKESERSQDAKIATDINKGVEHKASIEALRKDQAGTRVDVDDIKKAPRRMFYGLLGVILTVVAGALSSAWFLAELSKDVEFERTQRTEQFKRIESQIKTVATKTDPAPMRRALKTLTEEVEQSNGHEEEYNRLCEGLPPHERRFMKTTLMKRGKRIPMSCLQ